MNDFKIQWFFAGIKLYHANICKLIEYHCISFQIQATSLNTYIPHIIKVKINTYFLMIEKDKDNL